MTYPAGRRRKPQCPIRIVIDFDSLTCHLPVDHKGLHEDVSENGTIIRWRTL